MNSDTTETCVLISSMFESMMNRFNLGFYLHINIDQQTSTEGQLNLIDAQKQKLRRAA